MKKIISAILCLELAFSLTACGGNTGDDRLSSSSSSTESSKSETVSGGKTLVVYYSATGSTKAVAEKIAKNLNADTFELVPEKPTQALISTGTTKTAAYRQSTATKVSARLRL